MYSIRIVERTWLTRLSATSKRVCSSLSLVCTLSSSLSCSLIFFCSAPSSSSRYPPEPHRHCIIRLVCTTPNHEAFERELSRASEQLGSPSGPRSPSASQPPPASGTYTQRPVEQCVRRLRLGKSLTLQSRIVQVEESSTHLSSALSFSSFMASIFLRIASIVYLVGDLLRRAWTKVWTRTDSTAKTSERQHERRRGECATGFDRHRELEFYSL